MSAVTERMVPWSVPVVIKIIGDDGGIVIPWHAIVSITITSTKPTSGVVALPDGDLWGIVKTTDGSRFTVAAEGARELARLMEIPVT